MGSQGSAHGRFTRAIAQRNLAAAAVAAKETGGLSLADALDYLVLLAELRPERAQPAALRWHGRLELESVTLTLVESQLALASLASLCSGDREAASVLRRLLRRVRPTLAPRIG
jgi:hypothetical protein